MPVSTIYSDLTRIACSSCSAQPGSGGSPVLSKEMEAALAAAQSNPGGDPDALLKDLKLKVLETVQTIETLSNEVYDKWVNTYKKYPDIFKKLSDFVAKHLTVTLDTSVTVKDHQATEHERSVVLALLQASNLALYLENEATEANQAAYGARWDSLRAAKARLLQVVCAARQLLDLSDTDTQQLVEDHAQHSLQLHPQATEGLRRAVCALALKRMVDVMGKIDLDKK